MVIPFTSWNTKIAGGAEVDQLVWRSGLAAQVLDPKDILGKLSDEGMAAFYQAADVIVLTTIGEGAGLPPLRARACGTPTLVSNNTSNTEFAGHEFELLPLTGSYYDPLGSNLQRYTTDAAVLTQRLEKYYSDDVFRRTVARAGMQTMRQYELAKVLPLWDALLEATP
jgi:glycosyltransferase involved in cell wall biosynthesis